MNEDGSGINVTLSNVCQSNQTCEHGTPGLDDIFQKYSVNGTCKDKPKWKTSRFPGEDCDGDNTCVVGSCVSGICSGLKFNEACNATVYCNAGNYCNGTNCVVQLKEGDTCSATWDCANHLGCYNNKCVQWGSQSVGADLNGTTNWMNDTINQGFKGVSAFCELGESNNNLVCSQTNYTGTTVAKVDNKTGFATCNWNEDCHYNDGSSTFTQLCGCGYNAVGQGYCPLASGQKTDLFKKQFKRIATQFKNDCHSQGRFTCYKVSDGIRADVSDAVHQTRNAHLLNDAVKCASDVLGSAYINMSIALIAILAAFLF